MIKWFEEEEELEKQCNLSNSRVSIHPYSCKCHK